MPEVVRNAWYAFAQFNFRNEFRMVLHKTDYNRGYIKRALVVGHNNYRPVNRYFAETAESDAASEYAGAVKQGVVQYIYHPFAYRVSPYPVTYHLHRVEENQQKTKNKQVYRGE